MGLLETFGWGVFGGFGTEAAVVFALRHTSSAEAPHWLRSPIYYFIAAIMILIGGGVAIAYARSGTLLSPFLAIQIGASTPLLLRKLRETVPGAPKAPPAGSVD
jgi:hypothetical protein